MHHSLLICLLVFVVLQAYLTSISAKKDKSLEEKSKSSSKDECQNDEDCPLEGSFKYTCEEQPSSSKSKSAPKKECVKEFIEAENCSAGQLYCFDRITCANFCDNIKDCPGGEDESNCTEPESPSENCSAGQLYCFDRITCANFCDNITDCPGGEDESNCTEPETPAEICSDGQLYCFDGITCAKFCDDITDCPGGEDETNCAECESCDCEDIFGLSSDCLSPTDGWILIQSYGIDGFNITTPFPVETRTECRDHCLINQDCKSFELVIPNSGGSFECKLNSATAGDALSASSLFQDNDHLLFLRACGECTLRPFYVFFEIA